MVAMPKKADVELTGRARVRAGWRGRLVLQVEVRTTIYSACPPMPGIDPREWRELMRSEGAQRLNWRDAGWDDMYSLHALELVPAGAIEPPQPWPRTPNVNPRPGHPAPPATPKPPPMADTTYDCDEHFYDGCPNCGRGKRKAGK
jgi:hypothetical protein